MALHSERLYTIVSARDHFSTQFNVNSISIKIRFKQFESRHEFFSDNYLLELLQFYDTAFSQIIEEIRIRYQIRQRDFIGIQLGIPTAANFREVGIAFREFRTLDTNMLTDRVSAVLQSSDSFLNTELLEMNVKIIHNNSGGSNAFEADVNESDQTESDSDSFNSDLEQADSTVVTDSFSSQPEQQCYYPFQPELDEQKFLASKKRSLFLVPNEHLMNDSKCLARSLVISKAFNEYGRRGVKDLFKYNCANLRKSTDSLIRRVFNGKEKFEKNTIDDHAILKDLHQFSKHLKDYQIIVYSDLEKHTKPFFSTLRKSKKLFIYYLSKTKHFVAIKTVCGLFSKKYQCSACDSVINNFVHRCRVICPCCKSNSGQNYETFTKPCMPVDNEKMLKCNDCNRSFRGENCFKNHLEKNKAGLNTCKRFKICEFCFNFIDVESMKRKKIQHLCNSSYCVQCKKTKSTTETIYGHLCYISVREKKPFKKNFILIFYDTEATQNTLNIDAEFMQNPSKQFKHELNLVVSQTLCALCFEIQSHEHKCIRCVYRNRVFSSDSCAKDFFNYVFSIKLEKGERIFLIAHCHSYDLNLLLPTLFEFPNLKIQPILNGSKIRFLTVSQKYIFIDSFAFLPMSLSKLCKDFIPEEKDRKLYFPHLFNTKENRHYHGPWPDKRFYDTDQFKTEKEKQQFDEWFETVKGEEYNHFSQLIYYCIRDVEVLSKICLKFAQIFYNLSGIFALTECFTLSQLIFDIFRQNYLKANTLGITPLNNYSKKLNTSNVARKYLCYKRNFETINTQKLLIVPEFSIPKTPRIVADGLLVREDNSSLLLFLHGCFWHFHKDCLETKYLDYQMRKPDLAREMLKRSERTNRQLEHLKKIGYKFEIVYECVFNKLLKNNMELAYLINNSYYFYGDRLKIGDAMRGGRVEAFKMFFSNKIDKTRKVAYSDIQSLYPAVLYNHIMCIGHPIIYRDGDCEFFMNTNELLNIHGVIKAAILAPQDLYIPLLGFRCEASKRLVFALCRTCSELRNCSQCRCIFSDKLLLGTFTLVEIHTAIKLGYKLVKIYEIWQYKTSQFNKHTGETGIFSQIVKDYAKLKITASGFPHNVKSKEEKQRYIQAIKDQYDITLNEEEIKLNPSKRLLGKLALNSLFGRFGMKNIEVHTSVVNSKTEFESLISNPMIEIMDLFLPCDNYCWIQWKFKENVQIPEQKRKIRNTSIIVSAYVLAQARLVLYSYLEKLQQNILYFDTDGILYTYKEKPDEHYPITDRFGEMSNELEKEIGENETLKEIFISQYVCVTNKTYAYEITKVDKFGNSSISEVIKAKGFSLNLKSAKQLNFESFKNFVFDNHENIPCITTSQSRIRRQKHFNIVTMNEIKRLNLSYDKRIILPDENLSTIPYGYIPTNK